MWRQEIYHQDNAYLFVWNVVWTHARTHTYAHIVILSLFYCCCFLCNQPTNQKHIYTFLVRKARKSAQAYKKTYGETQPVSQLVKQTASVMQEFTQSGGVRPFGISVLVAGSDGDGTPRLYQVDPSGAYFGWKATAIGKVRSTLVVVSSIIFFL